MFELDSHVLVDVHIGSQVHITKCTLSDPALQTVPIPNLEILSSMISIHWASTYSRLNSQVASWLIPRGRTQ